MTQTQDFKREMARVRRFAAAKQFNKALAIVENLLKRWPGNSSLLVKRAGLIQLQDDADGAPTLDDAKQSLQTAVELDDVSPDALTELGYFYYAVEDNAATASRCFERAIERSKQLLRAATRGYRQAESELKQRENSRSRSARGTRPSRVRHGNGFSGTASAAGRSTTRPV